MIHQHWRDNCEYSEFQENSVFPGGDSHMCYGALFINSANALLLTAVYCNNEYVMECHQKVFTFRHPANWEKSPNLFSITKFYSMLCRSSMHTTSQYYRHIKQKWKNFFKKWSYTWSWFWVKLAVKKLSGRSHISFLTLDWIEAMEINIHQPLCAVLFYFYTFFAVVWCFGFVLISLVNDDGKHKEWDILFWLLPLLDFIFCHYLILWSILATQQFLWAHSVFSSPIFENIEEGLFDWNSSKYILKGKLPNAVSSFNSLFHRNFCYYR